MTDATRIDRGPPTRMDIGRVSPPTRLEADGGPVPLTGASLPPRLASKYKVINAFDTTGAEADLYLAERRLDCKRCVLKLYRRGLHPKVEVLEKLRNCDRRFVIQTFESGAADELWFEVLEYSEKGTLRNLLSEGPCPTKVLLPIVTRLSAAVSYIHEAGMVHRDLKPENILMRSREPLDLVLSDFGISSLTEATHHFTTRSRTIKYGAPESAVGAVGPASDYWSLGLIVLESLLGRHPFDGLSDLSIAMLLATGRIETAAVPDIRWRLLCRGLLTRDPKKRWGNREVLAWLSGQTPMAVDDDVIRPSQKPYKIAKQECWTASELAIALGRNWKEGERHLARGLILPWLRDELRDQDAANLLIDLTEDRVLANEDRLLRLIVGLGKGLPPVWRSISLDRETLESHCRNALSENTEDADIVADVFNHGVLRVWGDAGHEDCAAWQRSWIADAQIFPELWKKLVDNGGPDKKLPSPNNYLPALLLMILSQEFRKSLREEITQHSVAIARCFWFKNARLGQSNASLLVSQSFLESAREQGETEIESAENVRIALYKLQTDFASVLVSHSHLRSAVAKIEGQLANNRAWEARTSSLPALSRDLFEQAKTTLVSESVSYQWRRGWSDCAIDGIIFGAIMVGVRSLSGYVMAGDALGFVGERLNATGPLAGGGFPLGLVIVIAGIGFWGVGRLVSRYTSRRLFGRPKGQVDP